MKSGPVVLYRAHVENIAYYEDLLIHKYELAQNLWQCVRFAFIGKVHSRFVCTVSLRLDYICIYQNNSYHCLPITCLKDPTANIFYHLLGKL